MLALDFEALIYFQSLHSWAPGPPAAVVQAKKSVQTMQ